MAVGDREQRTGSVGGAGVWRAPRVLAGRDGGAATVPDLGIDDRVGSLAPGKDADIALFDGDPFEYTSHCVGVLIDGDSIPVSKR